MTLENLNNASSSTENRIPLFQNRIFFLYGPGYTGKTFVRRNILGHLEVNRKNIITCGTYSVAAKILPLGKTAHSTFMVPITVKEDTMRETSAQSSLTKYIRQVYLIVYNYIVMCKKFSLETQ